MAHQINLTAAWKKVDDNTWERKFNWVAPIEETDEIFLSFENNSAASDISISMNENELGKLESSQLTQDFEITSILQPKNHIRVTTNKPLDDIWDRVFLKIK